MILLVLPFLILIIYFLHAVWVEIDLNERRDSILKYLKNKEYKTKREAYTWLNKETQCPLN